MANPLEDVWTEFKSAPPAGKALGIIAFLTVAGLGMYVYEKNKSSSSASTQGGLLPIDLTGTDLSGNSDTTTTGNGSATGGTGSTGGTGGNQPPPNTGGQPQPPPPQSATYVTVQKWTPTNTSWASDLWGIAQHYYGNGALWPTIYNANKSIIGSNPNIIQPGMRLLVPNTSPSK